jgi:hypothetical protein
MLQRQDGPILGDQSRPAPPRHLPRKEYRRAGHRVWYRNIAQLHTAADARYVLDRRQRHVRVITDADRQPIFIRQQVYLGLIQLLRCRRRVDLRPRTAFDFNRIH